MFIAGIKHSMAAHSTGRSTVFAAPFFVSLAPCHLSRSPKRARDHPGCTIGGAQSASSAARGRRFHGSVRVDSPASPVALAIRLSLGHMGAEGTFELAFGVAKLISKMFLETGFALGRRELLTHGDGRTALLNPAAIDASPAGPASRIPCCRPVATGGCTASSSASLTIVASSPSSMARERVRSAHTLARQ
jgi:hypothetical protein